MYHRLWYRGRHAVYGTTALQNGIRRSKSVGSVHVPVSEPAIMQDCVGGTDSSGNRQTAREIRSDLARHRCSPAGGHHSALAISRDDTRSILARRGNARRFLHKSDCLRSKTCSTANTVNKKADPDHRSRVCPLPSFSIHPKCILQI